jgi:multiple sugar transport system permease protein
MKPLQASHLKRSITTTAYLFILPTLVLLIVFRIIPMFQSAYLSLTSYSFVNPAKSKYIGLKNFLDMFKDKYVWRALWHTVHYSIGSLIPGVVISLLYALVIVEKWFKFSGFARVVFFIPVVLSMAIAGVLFSWLYHPTIGFFNYILYSLNLPPVKWLGDPKIAMNSVILMVIWKNLGYNITIWCAGLLSIPDEFRDAGKIDGANAWQDFWYIRFPMLRDVLLFLTVLGFLGSFQSFDAIYVLTGGGPMLSTRVIVYYLWQNAFSYYKMGYASAQAWLLFVILIGLTYFQFRAYRER